MTLLRNTVIHADCTQFLPSLPSESVDFILTDPPYLTDTGPAMDEQSATTATSGSNPRLLKCTACLPPMDSA